MGSTVAVLTHAYRRHLADLAPEPDVIGTPQWRSLVAAVVQDWVARDVGGAPSTLQPLCDRLVEELAGFGPLDRLLADESVDEILVNDCRAVYVETEGVLRRVEVEFHDEGHLRAVIDRMLCGSERRLDHSTPVVDARIAGVGRVHAALPPIAPGGAVLSIRRPPRRRRHLADLVDGGMLDGRMAAFLHAATLGRCNVLISGAAGTGKTTLLAALGSLVPHHQRIITLEDVVELAIDHPHVVAQQIRPADADGPSSVTLRDLLRHSLRMRPDRLVIGEVRGAEAADFVMAMNTGHDGSMTTVHANGCSDAIRRVESLLLLQWPRLTPEVLRGQIVSALDVLVHCDRDSQTGHRFVAMIAAVDAADDGGSVVVPLYRRVLTAGTPRFATCGEVPRRPLERMARHGVRFPPHLFAAGRVA